MTARDAALAEFGALRAEINTRMSTTATFVGLGLTALGALLALVVKDHGDRRLLLIVPPLAFAVNTLWAIENRQMGFIGKYIRTRLWPYLRAGDKCLPSWEEECAARRRGFGNSLRSLVTDYVMTLLFAAAAFASLVFLGASFRVGGHVKLVNPGVRALDWAVAVAALIVPFLMTFQNTRSAEGSAPEARPPSLGQSQ